MQQNKMFIWCISRYYLLFLASIIFGIINIYPQDNKDEIIAQIGNEKITASEFTELYELSPHISRDNSDSLIGKVNFLNTLLAYKLWYRGKESLKIDTSLAYITAVQEVRKMFVRDALYRKEIPGKINITPQEISSAKEKLGKTLIVNYILSAKEEEIKNLQKVLDAGYPFDSLLSEREEAAYQTEPVAIKFGDYNEIAENILFSLKPGTYSSIIQFRDGYYIFYLKNIIKEPGKEEEDSQKISDVIKDRREHILYDQFMKNILNGVKADVNYSLFEKLEGKLIYAFRNGKQKFAKDSLLYLSGEQYLTIENSFSEKELNRAFVSLPGDTISLKNCLRALFFDGIKMPGKDSLIVKETFNNYIKNFISMEVIYREGEKQGLSNLHEVQKYVKMWSEFYAFETVRGFMLDTVQVSITEINEEYNNQYKSDLTGNMNYDEAKQLIRNRIANYKISKTITEKTAQLASGEVIKINYNALKKIETTRINSFTMRNLGFGGSISGVPLYIPNYEWVNLIKPMSIVP